MDWIPFKADGLVKAKPAILNGANVIIALSPYDIPVAFRPAIDRANHLFLFEFKYPTEETTVERVIAPGVCAQLGENSERVYMVSFDIDMINKGEIDPATALGQAFTIPFSKRGKMIFEHRRNLADEAIGANKARIDREVDRVLCS